MLVPALAARSLRNRLLTSTLTLLSIAFSVALLVGVENVRTGVRESFANTIRGTDLIVGARGGTLQILLYSVFGMGSPTMNVSHETYEKWAAHPAVEWTIPYSLGDSHRGYRVVGTTGSFYEHYRYRRDGRVTFAAGRAPETAGEVAVGSEVAERLGYAVGDPVVLTHGLRGGGIMDHDDRPFTVVGVLGRTSTPIDRSLYVTLDAIERIHEGWEQGVPPSIASAAGGAPPAMPGATPPAMPGATPPPMPGAAPMVMPGATPPAMPGASAPPAASGGDGDHAHAASGGTQITAFFVGTKNRFEALQLQREMNTDLTEPVTAVIPGVALAELWRTIGYAEDGLRVISIFVVVVGLIGMLLALYSSLEARRREMAILRAIGAGPRKIVGLLVLESGLLATLGALLGVGLVYALLAVAQGPVESAFGLYLPIRPPGRVELAYVGLVMAAGFVLGIVPAWRAYRNSLVDGLSPRV
ncbi:MAG TPA: ABC transporter permease [Gemmatimonadales bacterium]